MNTKFSDIRDRVVGFQTEIESIKKSVDSNWIDPPEIDFSQDLKTFAESLRVQDPEKREPSLRKFVANRVDKELEGWHAKVRPLLDMRQRVDDIDHKMDREERDIEAQRIAQTDREMEAEDKLSKKVRQIDKDESRLRELTPANSFSTWSVWILISIVTLIAIATAYYYLAAQGQVEVAKAGGATEYFVNRDTDKFTVWDFIMENPLNILYGFGALLFFAIGKGTGIVYSILGHPKWMLILTFVLSVLVVLGTVLIVSQVQNQSLTMTTAEREVKAIDKGIEDRILAGFSPLECTGADSGNAECVRLLEARAALASEQQSTQGLTFYLSISILLAEILLGSFVWIYATNHFELKAPNQQSFENKVAAGQKELDVLKTRRETLLAEKRVLEEARDRLGSQKVELSGIQSQLLGPDAISRLKQTILADQEAKAQQAFMEARLKWRNDGGVENA